MVGAYNFLKKYGGLIAGVLGLLLNVLMYAVIIGGYPEGNPTNKELYAVGGFDFPLTLCFVMILIMSPLSFLFGFVIQLIRSPKAAIKPLVSIVAVVLLFVIFYNTSSGEITPEAIKMGIGEGAVKIVGACLSLTYLFTLAAGLSLLFAGVWGAVRSR